MKNQNPQLSPLAAEMVAGLSAFCDALEAGEPIEEALHGPNHYARSSTENLFRRRCSCRP